MTGTKQVVVLGAEDVDLERLRRLYIAPHVRFCAALGLHDIRTADRIYVRRTLKTVRRQLHAFPRAVDGIVGFWDFPVSTIVPILAREFKVPGPSLESVLKCEHKYWSRLEQKAVLPDHTPAFCKVDPFAANPLSQVPLPFPFWLKPVKAFRSQLGFRIGGRADFDNAIPVIRREIPRLARPFDEVLACAELPPEVVGVTGRYCIAEEMISAGRQCTLEGYVHEGCVTVYGVVDSIRHQGASTFANYRYPSSLPCTARKRMAELAETFVKHIDYRDACFNMEFFYNPDTDAIWLLETNTRISESHGPLFEKVDGTSHERIMVDVALGRKPTFPRRRGRFACAAKFMIRVFEDCRVRAIPSRGELDAIRREIPGTDIELHVQPGMRLSELADQDSYSYEVGVVFVGGESPADLQHKFDRIGDALHIEFSAGE